MGMGIAESVGSHAKRLREVNNAVTDVDRVTQQNAAMVEQTTAAARSLATEARELAQVASRFETGRGAESHGHYG